MAGFDAIAAAYVELRPKLAANFEQEASGDVVGAVGKIAGAAAGVWASAKVFDAAKSGLDELNEASKVDSQTGTLLKNLGDSASITQGDVDKLGQSMLDLAGFDDEAARSAANVALRFGDAHNSGELQRFETTAANLAVTMGSDLPSAAQTLGQILQSPENAARKLRPIIGDLTDTQKESIKAFVDQGNVAGAQDVIYKALEQSIGGTAAAYGEKLPASLDRASENFKNLEADLVSGFAPAVGFVADQASAASQALEGMPEPLKLIAGGAIAGTTAIFGLIEPITGAVTAVNSLRTARLLNAGAADAETVAEAGNTVGKEALSAATVVAAGAEERADAARAASVTETAALTAAELQLEAARIQSILTGEGYVSTQAQVIAAQEAEAAALQAQSAASAQALLSHDALIASAEALAASEAEATAATLALATAQREALAVNSSLAVDALYEETAATEGMTASSVGLAGALGPLGIGAAALAGTYAVLGDKADYVTGLFGILHGGLIDTSDVLSSMGVVGAAASYGLDQIGDSSLHGSVSAGVLATKLHDTTTELSPFGRSQADAKAAVDAATAAMKTQADALDGIKQGFQAAADARNGLVDTQLGAQGADLARRDALSRQTDAQKALNDANATGDPAKIEKANRDLERANLDVERAVNAQAKAQAEANAQTDIAAGKTHNAAQTATDYLGGLQLLNGGITGPTHDALDGLITQLQTASQDYDSKLSYELSINGYVLDPAEVHALLDAGLGGSIGTLENQQRQKDSGDYATQGPHAYGGPVGPGYSNKVGELGEEWLTINTDGTGWVTPIGSRSQQAKSGGYSPTFVVHGDPSPDAMLKWQRLVDHDRLVHGDVLQLSPG